MKRVIVFALVLVVVHISAGNGNAQQSSIITTKREEEFKKLLPDSALKLMELANRQQDSLSLTFGSRKSVYYCDTGFIVLSGLHHIYSFISSNAVDLKTCIKDNQYVRFSYINSDQLKKMMLEDTFPDYVKVIKECEIYEGNVRQQRSVPYFKARITLKLSLEGLAYLPAENYNIGEHYLLLNQDKTYLYPIFSGFVQECIDFVPMK
ncbi:hypothetical protein [Taibaiella helva]|uniref:hypothetical protein n=1 Tax=Taibaiella helva TaxID=2301235 RepID=UPI000E5755EE|nr:hypothetical protein [Taibaiella helva]